MRLIDADYLTGRMFTEADLKDAHTCYDSIRAIIESMESEDVFDKIRAEILEEKECAYADFEKYKVDYLGVDSRYVEDELPYDDFRYGMERCIEIIDKYRKERMNEADN